MTAKFDEYLREHPIEKVESDPLEGFYEGDSRGREKNLPVELFWSLASGAVGGLTIVLLNWVFG